MTRLLAAVIATNGPPKEFRNFTLPSILDVRCSTLGVFFLLYQQFGANAERRTSKAEWGDPPYNLDQRPLTYYIKRVLRPLCLVALCLAALTSVFGQQPKATSAPGVSPRPLPTSVPGRAARALGPAENDNDCHNNDDRRSARHRSALTDESRPAALHPRHNSGSVR